VRRTDVRQPEQRDSHEPSSTGHRRPKQCPELRGRATTGACPLRAAGLIGALVAACLEIHDDGDLPEHAWAPDRAHPYAQNAQQVSTGTLT
jgi:hypothetical protein